MLKCKKLNKQIYNIKFKYIFFISLIFFNLFLLNIKASEFSDSFNSIKTITDISKQNFKIIENQCFDVKFENFGNVKFIPAYAENKQKSSAVFLANSKDEIIYKTADLKASNFPFSKISAVSFKDVDKDGLKDILIISECKTEFLYSEDIVFKIADVLFQNSETFNYNYEITEELNRYDMNKNIAAILSYFNENKTKKLLYTSETLDKLEENGLKVIQDQSFWTDFESLGKIKVVTGTYNMGGLNHLYIYIVSPEGNIIDSFNPMVYHDNFKKLKGITFKDINGDNLKDIVVLAEYSNIKDSSKFASCNIYIQNERYFDSDRYLERDLYIKDSDNLNDAVDTARKLYQIVHN